MPLVAGDMVLSRNTQYVAKSGPRKFETTQEGVETFEVLQCRQGFAKSKISALDKSLGNTKPI
jgi:hypothetical protein